MFGRAEQDGLPQTTATNKPSFTGVWVSMSPDFRGRERGVKSIHYRRTEPNWSVGPDSKCREIRLQSEGDRGQGRGRSGRHSQTQGVLSSGRVGGHSRPKIFGDGTRAFHHNSPCPSKKARQREGKGKAKSRGREAAMDHILKTVRIHNHLGSVGPRSLKLGQRLFATIAQREGSIQRRGAGTLTVAQLVLGRWGPGHGWIRLVLVSEPGRDELAPRDMGESDQLHTLLAHCHQVALSPSTSSFRPRRPPPAARKDKAVENGDRVLTLGAVVGLIPENSPPLFPQRELPRPSFCAFVR